MSNEAIIGAGGAAANYAAIAQAIKASGAIVHVEPEDFNLILTRAEKPLVVASQAKFIKTTYQYLTSYKGLFFYTKSSSALRMDSRAEIISAKKIWIPV
jgi:hypothetical protein